MKKQISVVALTARSSLFFVLAIAAAMAAAELFLFHRALDGAVAGIAQELADYLAAREASGLTTDAESIARMSELSVPLGDLLNKSGILWVWRAALVLLTVRLCRVGCAFGAQPGYTLRRLALSERAVVLWQTVGNALFYVFLWGAQAALALAFCALYAGTAAAHAGLPQVLSGQLMFQLVYQAPFLHGLLPLEDLLGSAAVLTAVAVLAFTTAAFPFFQRWGGFCGEVIPVLAVLLLFTPRAVNDGNNAFLLAGAVLSGGSALIRVLTKKEVDVDEPADPVEGPAQA